MFVVVVVFVVFVCLLLVYLFVVVVFVCLFVCCCCFFMCDQKDFMAGHFSFIPKTSSLVPLGEEGVEDTVSPITQQRSFVSIRSIKLSTPRRNRRKFFSSSDSPDMRVVQVGVVTLMHVIISAANYIN